MKNRITKLFIAICAIFSFVLVGFNLSPKAEASAFTATTSTYNITNSGGTFYVTRGLDGTDEDVATNVTTLQGCFDAIYEDENLGANDTISILFNVTISTEEQITLTRNFVFSGMLNTDNASSLFVCENPSADKDQEIVCDDIIFSSTNDEINEGFAFFEVNNSKTFFTLNNTTFAFFKTYDATSHAIKFNSTNNKLLLKGEVVHNTTYLYNYTSGTLLYLDQDNLNGDDFFADPDGNPTGATEKIRIAIPYTANNSLISSNVEYSNVLLIELVADDNFFTASITSNNGSLYVSVESTFTFDTNGGTFATANAAPVLLFYNNSTPYTFPNQTQITKDYHHFIGWFGQIEYNGQTYYFDKVLIEEYVTHGSNPATIPTFFKTNLNTFTAENSFTNYSYTSNGTAEQYAKYYPVTVMAENRQSAKFIAKWELDSYNVTYNTNGGTSVATETYDYGSAIIEPTTIPTKTGYTFDKWYKDAALTIPFDFTSETMPAENITIYAGYLANNYTITFETNSTETIDPISYNFGETIQAFETITKEGNNFEGWFLNEELTIPFDYETMPAEDFTVYAKWTLKKIKVYFNSKGGSMINEIFVDYGTYVTIPATPTKTGSVFDGWYYDYNCTNDKKVVWEDNKIQIKTQITFYAKWIELPYHLVFQDGNNRIDYKTYSYGATIELITPATKQNHIFGGWYADAGLTTPFTLTKMPAENTYVYAKWISKIIITIDETPQTYVADTINPTFELDSDLQNFVIKYKVDGEWVIDAPTNVGAYDVMISRNEDDTYARFETLIENGYTIEPIIADYTWLIAILFAVFALEIIVTIAVRILRKLKKNMVITSLAIVSGNTIIPSNQVVLITIAAICALAGFVMMCYQLVKLHRTLPLALVNPEDEDSSMEKHFKHSEKIIKAETHSYTAQDVEDMLLHDTVGHAIKEKHNLNNFEQEENKEKVPIGPIAYSEEHDNMQKVEDDFVENENQNASKVEIIEDEFIANDTDDNDRLYNSDDPFLRKDPNDYSNNRNED